MREVNLEITSHWICPLAAASLSIRRTVKFRISPPRHSNRKRISESREGGSAQPVLYPGVPRVMYLPFPADRADPKYVLVASEFAHAAHDYMDGSKHPGDADFGSAIHAGIGRAKRWSWTSPISIRRPGSTGRNFHSDVLHIVRRFTRTSRICSLRSQD
jgi:hypothetical protein